MDSIEQTSNYISRLPKSRQSQRTEENEKSRGGRQQKAIRDGYIAAEKWLVFISSRKIFNQLLELRRVNWNKLSSYTRHLETTL